jgi:hypothetical protein
MTTIFELKILRCSEMEEMGLKRPHLFSDDEEFAVTQIMLRQYSTSLLAVSLQLKLSSSL